MDISLNDSVREITPQTLQYLVQRINNPQYETKLSEAEALCSAYPNLNKEVVKISLMLLGLCNSGCINNRLEEVLDVLPDVDVEQKVKIVSVMIEAQTAYATGEAKIVQYYS